MYERRGVPAQGPFRREDDGEVNWDPETFSCLLQNLVGNLGLPLFRCKVRANAFHQRRLRCSAKVSIMWRKDNYSASPHGWCFHWKSFDLIKIEKVNSLKWNTSSATHHPPPFFPSFFLHICSKQRERSQYFSSFLVLIYLKPWPRKM